MFIWMSAFCAGTIILYCSGILLSWHAYIISILVILCIPKQSLRQTCVPIVIFLILGHAYASYEAKSHIDNILPAHFENIALQAQGYFCSLPRKSLHTDTAEFCVTSVIHPKTKTLVLSESRIYLRWPKRLSSELEANDKVFDLALELRRPRGTLNPIGSNYEQYLFQKRIVATGTILSILPTPKLLVLPFKDQFIQSSVQVRKYISSHLDQLFVGLEHKGLLKALLLGDRSKISKSDNDILSRTGTQHLMAISGLHVGAVLILLYQFLPKLRRSVVLIALLGLAYVVLVGFGTSAQRAWVMSVIAIIYLMGFLPPNLSRPFIIGLTVVLLLDPLAPLGMGFWYSFLSVGLLLLLVYFGPKSNSVWKMLLLTQLVLLLGLTPINAHFGLPHSFSSSLANLIAIPWVSMVVLPFSLASLLLSIFIPELSVVLFTVLNEVLHCLMTFLASLSSVNVQLEASDSLPLSFIFYLLLMFGLLLYRLKAMLALMVVSFIVYYLFPSSNSKAEVEQLIVFDAGQGLALGVQGGGVIWLYDTGAAYEKSSVAQRVILPYLRAQNLTGHIEGLIVSHGDWDHAGGVADLLSEIDVKFLWAGEVGRLQGAPKGHAVSCVESMRWMSESFQVDVLYPLKTSSVSQHMTANNHSCVVRVVINGVRFLLMGDLESEAELEFVRYYKHRLKSDVLIAGHHGSNNASSYALLKHVLPEYIVFSAGYQNRFGHPHAQVIKRAQQFNIKTYDTATSGAIVFNIDSSSPLDGKKMSLKVQTIRSGTLPFWILKEDNMPL